MADHTKAIETVYKGFRFRSRLEARYGVFFEALGIKYEYEKEGFDLGEFRYLPDFYLPEYSCWIEIKSEYPSDDEGRKAGLLAYHTGQWVDIFYGLPGTEDFGCISYVSNAPSSSLAWHAEQAIERGEGWFLASLRNDHDRYYWDGLVDKYDQAHPDKPLYLPTISYSEPYREDYRILTLCPKCKRLMFGHEEYSEVEFIEIGVKMIERIRVTLAQKIENDYPPTFAWCDTCNEAGDPHEPLLISAGVRAKQARFEHGEKG